MIKISAYVGEVELDVIAQCRVVDADHVIDAAGGDHSSDRAPSDPERLPLGKRPFRIEAPVADDVGFNRNYALVGGKPLAALGSQAAG